MFRNYKSLNFFRNEQMSPDMGNSVCMFFGVEQARARSMAIMVIKKGSVEYCNLKRRLRESVSIGNTRVESFGTFQ